MKKIYHLAFHIFPMTVILYSCSMCL